MLGIRKCACGCKTDISGTHGLRKYVDNQHKDRVNNSKKKKERVEFDQYKIDKAAYLHSMSILKQLLGYQNKVIVSKSHLDLMNVKYDMESPYVISFKKDRIDYLKIGDYILKDEDESFLIYKKEHFSAYNIS